MHCRCHKSTAVYMLCGVSRWLVSLDNACVQAHLTSRPAWPAAAHHSVIISFIVPGEIMLEVKCRCKHEFRDGCTCSSRADEAPTSACSSNWLCSRSSCISTKSFSCCCKNCLVRLWTGAYAIRIFTNECNCVAPRGGSLREMRSVQ
jgi:hypothetical protein